jgi:protein-disulfide isomerase
MVLGIPVALVGGIWFAGAGLLATSGLVARPEVREDVPTYLFVMSTLGLAVVLYLGYASFVLLKTLCLVCLTTYAAVIGIFIVSGGVSSVPLTSLPRRLRRDARVLLASPAAIAVVLLFLGGAASALAFFPREGAALQAAAGQPAPTANQQSEFERFMATEPRVSLPVSAEGAQVLVVKFNDFQCPPCRQSHQLYKPVLAKYEAEHPGAVRYVLKDYPLDSKCNENVVNGGPHPSACDAAVAVRLAREHDRGDAMIEWIFANQPSLTSELVRQAAHDVGGVNDFQARYQSTLALVKADIALGKQFGVKATPTFFINGLKVDGALPVQYFQQALEYELAHHRSQ